MIAFHNKQEIKDQLVAQLEAHYAADEIVQGKYWEGGKGCAVGCCVHGNRHDLFPELFGIPESIAYLMDGIFEELPSTQAKEFPLQVIRAISVGADLTTIENQFLEWLLIDLQHGVARFNSHPSIPAVAALHRRVIEGDSVSTEEWDAAWDAARDAAWDAARDAAWAAARAAQDAARAAQDAAWAAAWDAARAAQDAARAAQDAAWAAARAAQANKLVELLALASIPSCH